MRCRIDELVKAAALNQGASRQIRTYDGRGVGGQKTVKQSLSNLRYMSYWIFSERGLLVGGNSQNILAPKARQPKAFPATLAANPPCCHALQAIASDKSEGGDVFDISVIMSGGASSGVGSVQSTLLFSSSPFTSIRQGVGSKFYPLSSAVWLAPVNLFYSHSVSQRSRIIVWTFGEPNCVGLTPKTCAWFGLAGIWHTSCHIACSELMSLPGQLRLAYYVFIEEICGRSADDQFHFAVVRNLIVFHSILYFICFEKCLLLI